MTRVKNGKEIVKRKKKNEGEREEKVEDYSPRVGQCSILRIARIFAPYICKSSRHLLFNRVLTVSFELARIARATLRLARV